MRLHPFFLYCLFFTLATCSSSQRHAPDQRAEPSQLTISSDAREIIVLNNNRPILSYNITANLPAGLPNHYRRSGYFHPVYSPSGQIITDGFPVGYAHQHGIFTAWTKTKFRGREVDFWNTQKGLATVRHVKTSRVDTAGKDEKIDFETTLNHYALIENDSLAVLQETLEVTVHDREDVYVWDLTSRQQNTTQDTLFLLQHLYGGLGVRGSKHWNPKDSVNFTGPAQFLTSDGFARDSANHTKPIWTAMYGSLPNGKAGLAVIPHPDNLSWPQPVRVHPNLPYFSVSPVVFAPAFIAPGEVVVARYRFVTFDGLPQAGLLSELAWE
ncbi:DUF6807 domain-containing protein [Neolewinella antarctica]|uniref:Methane oxygenase PmoA n=1 Tax=Neolewinella antarctica TaxID=442734 RepID=A0ABX0XCQ4_9BACT|nr:PmoA family protein [Neolewinella antarctica]NJC27055.1 hypothetical protein [Neolewinella antarctica]